MGPQGATEESQGGTRSHKGVTRSHKGVTGGSQVGQMGSQGGDDEGDLTPVPPPSRIYIFTLTSHRSCRPP